MSSSKPTNQALYDRIKKRIFTENPINSAYRSGALVREYKKQGGTFEGTKPKTEGLSRWFKEDWKDISGGKGYPVYRPTKRITKDTPLTADEISPTQLKKQIRLKQKIKETDSLPDFVPKKGK